MASGESAAQKPWQYDLLFLDKTQRHLQVLNLPLHLCGTADTHMQYCGRGVARGMQYCEDLLVPMRLASVGRLLWFSNAWESSLLPTMSHHLGWPLNEAELGSASRAIWFAMQLSTELCRGVECLWGPGDGRCRGFYSILHWDNRSLIQMAPGHTILTNGRKRMGTSFQSQTTCEDTCQISYLV